LLDSIVLIRRLPTIRSFHPISVLSLCSDVLFVHGRPENAVLDECDIGGGFIQDRTPNSIPDECDGGCVE
jgi:hypothetical protein